MPKSPKPRKKRSIMLRLDLHEWIEKQIMKGKFKNFSYAVDVALENLKDSRKGRRDRR